MSTFPGSPKLLKGAIVGLDPDDPLASGIPFQFNPAEISRTLTPRQVQEKAPSKGRGFFGPPRETIHCQIKLSALGPLEKSDKLAMAMGIYPQISALEMLMTPKAKRILANQMLARAGTLEVVPSDPPLVLFVWGIKRVLPVRVGSFSVTETQFDTQLNPISAGVDLALEVLTYEDFDAGDFGYNLFLVNQIAKEAMAVVGSLGNLASVGLSSAAL